MWVTQKLRQLTYMKIIQRVSLCRLILFAGNLLATVTFAFIFDRELHAAGVMKLIPLRTPLMVADALTKSLPGPVLTQHREVMLGHTPSLVFCTDLFYVCYLRRCDP
jgi:hypothetical protein